MAGLASLGLRLSTLLMSQPLLAQVHWPSRPVRLIVVYPHGGLSDDTARVLARQMALRLGVSVTVDNRAGAGGSVGMSVLAKAPPDGHTLAFSAISTLTLLPHFIKVSYDPLRDIAPVASVMHTPVLVVGTPAFSGSNFEDLLTQARNRPGEIRWATSGVGTLGHMVLEQVRRASSCDVTHIPYKGGGQQLTDALAGHFEVLSTNAAAAQLQHIRSGKFNPLAVGSPVRLSVLPHVPTLAELGFARANLSSLFGIFAPGGTPLAIVRRLNLEINAILQQHEFQERLIAVSNLPAAGSVEDFTEKILLETLNTSKLLDGSVKTLAG